MNDLFFKLSPMFAAVIGALLTLMFTRQKQIAEIEKIKAEKAKIDHEHVQGVITMWQGLVEDLTTDVKELTNEVEQLRQENKVLKTEMKKLEKLLNEKVKS